MNVQLRTLAAKALRAGVDDVFFDAVIREYDVDLRLVTEDAYLPAALAVVIGTFTQLASNGAAAHLLSKMITQTPGRVLCGDEVYAAPLRALATGILSCLALLTVHGVIRYYYDAWNGETTTSSHRVGGPGGRVDVGDVPKSTRQTAQKAVLAALRALAGGGSVRLPDPRADDAGRLVQLVTPAASDAIADKLRGLRALEESDGFHASGAAPRPVTVANAIDCIKVSTQEYAGA